VQGRDRIRIVVVRHGLAEPKKGWHGPDDDRPLVARGFRQAERLASVIGADRPSRVLSSPALRCRQTVEPFACRHGVEVEMTDALATTAGPEAFALCEKLVATAEPDATYVLCTHREILVDLLPGLAKEYGRKLGHRPPGAKGGAWALAFRAGRLAKVDYRPPAA
jgi:8-oxo-dGTP diphosphatase